MKKVQKAELSKMGITKRPPHCEKIAPVKAIKGKAQKCFAVARLYRVDIVNIQKIQNGDSEFFANSLCDFKC